MSSTTTTTTTTRKISIEKIGRRYTLRGRTLPVKDLIKSYGAKWDPTSYYWWTGKSDLAEEIADAASKRLSEIEVAEERARQARIEERKLQAERDAKRREEERLARAEERRLEDERAFEARMAAMEKARSEPATERQIAYASRLLMAWGGAEYVAQHDLHSMTKAQISALIDKGREALGVED